jgi:rubrerythrin
MNVFKLAKKREKAMEELYFKLAETTDNKGLKGIFLDLASAEGAHHSSFSSLEDRSSASLFEEVDVDMKMTLREIDLRRDFLDPKLSQLEVYRKVRDYEWESQKFYESLLSRAHSDQLKSVLKEMADEERSHVIAMDNVIELVEMPETLRDDAEFGINTGI